MQKGKMAAGVAYLSEVLFMAWPLVQTTVSEFLQLLISSGILIWGVEAPSANWALGVSRLEPRAQNSWLRRKIALEDDHGSYDEEQQSRWRGPVTVSVCLSFQLWAGYHWGSVSPPPCLSWSFLLALIPVPHFTVRHMRDDRLRRLRWLGSQVS